MKSGWANHIELQAAPNCNQHAGKLGNAQVGKGRVKSESTPSALGIRPPGSVRGKDALEKSMSPRSAHKSQSERSMAGQKRGKFAINEQWRLASAPRTRSAPPQLHWSNSNVVAHLSDQEFEELVEAREQA
jgi:hypothetical protein